MPIKPKAEYVISAKDESTAGLRSALGKADAFQRTLKKTFATLGAVGGISLLAGVVKDSITLGDELNKAAIKAGTTGRVMSELAYAAKQSDIAITDLSTSIRFMQKAISEAAAGGRAQIETFQGIGLSIQTLRSLAPEKQFELIADRIAGIADPADRATAATQLFGRAGANLLPLFEQGAAGIRAAREEARKMGASFSDEQVKDLAEADDAIKRLSASWSSFATTLVASVAPAISRTLDALTELGNGTAMQRVGETLRFNAISQYGTAEQKAALLAGQRRTRGPTGAQRGMGVLSGSPELREADSKVMRELGNNFAWINQQLADQEALRDYILGLQDVKSATDALIEASDEGIAEGIGGSLETITDDLDAVAEKSFETTNAMSEYAKSAAQNMQSYLAQFFLDPAEEGFRGLAKGFVDSIRQMSAELASAKLLEGLMGKDGTSGLLGGALGALFGGGLGPVTLKGLGATRLATGTNYVPYDNFPALLHKGEAVVPAKYNNGGGSPVVNVNIHNDNRGATQDFMKVAPELFKRQAEMIEAKIVDGLRRKRYSGI